MNRKFVIDFNAFIARGGDKRVVIKELTVIDVGTKSVLHWIFKPPNDVANCYMNDRHNSWLSAHYHGLDFYSGHVEYEHLQSALEYVCSGANLLYAHDQQKAKVLESLFPSRRVVFSLEALGCPPLPKEMMFPGTVDYEWPEIVGKLNTNNSPQCLYHEVYAAGFVCTHSNATYLADWCASHSHMLDMNDAVVRERTFTDWKHETPAPADLAKVGFVRVAATVDTVSCVYCGLLLHQWEPEDDPEADHYTNSPFCKLLRYRMQLKRDEDAKEGGKDKKKKNNNIEPDDEIYFRNMADVTESEVFALCKA